MEIMFGVLLIVLIAFVVIYNRIKRNENAVEEGLSGIDVALKRRYDLIPNLVETVKAYAKHEKEVLESIVHVRKDSSQDAYDASGEAINKILAIAESYPELKADKNFLHLQRALMDVEEHIQAARRIYNRNVKELKNSVLTFPGSAVNLVAKVEPGKYFTIDDHQRSQVVVNLSDDA